MGYSALAIANYFIEKAPPDSVTPMKIQKLVFLAHGWHLGVTGKPLVDDEYAEAWMYGPVFPSLYHAFKRYGSDPIQESATDIDVNEDGLWAVYTPGVKEDDQNTVQCLDKIREVYGKMTGAKLSAITHASSSPWRAARDKGAHVRNTHIPNADVQKYYRGLAEKNKNKR